MAVVEIRQFEHEITTVQFLWAYSEEEVAEVLDHMRDKLFDAKQLLHFAPIVLPALLSAEKVHPNVIVGLANPALRQQAFRWGGFVGARQYPPEEYCWLFGGLPCSGNRAGCWVYFPLSRQ